MNKKLLIGLVLIAGAAGLFRALDGGLFQDGRAVALTRIARAEQVEAAKSLPIQQCEMQGEEYFLVRWSIVDGSDHIYDSSGKFVAQCASPMLSLVDAEQFGNPPMCKEIPAASCTDVYPIQ